jgi:hypothetical protein
MKRLCSYLACAALGAGAIAANAEIINGRESVVLTNTIARVVVDLAGGSIGEFRLLQKDVNPLTWAAPVNETSARPFGHFLCLDRWGPASASEAAQGMPYHGEASSALWKIESRSQHSAQLSATLPKAGLSVRRTITLSSTSAVFTVQEEITNQNPLGRIFNIVQHPTIAPPFLSETTVVDCNGLQGFAQSSPLPNPEERSAKWPNAINQAGVTIDIRTLKNDHDPNVVSYIFDEPHGWITASSPEKGLLLGYVWSRSDYPWINLWRDSRNGQPVARGLEFGSTGLHQPFAILVKKDRIWDRPLFEYIDSREKVTRSYTAFLCPIPADFSGVSKIRVDNDRLILNERRETTPRELQIRTSQ